MSETTAEFDVCTICRVWTVNPRLSAARTRAGGSFLFFFHGNNGGNGKNKNAPIKKIENPKKKREIGNAPKKQETGNPPKNYN